MTSLDYSIRVRTGFTAFGVSCFMYVAAFVVLWFLSGRAPAPRVAAPSHVRPAVASDLDESLAEMDRANQGLVATVAAWLAISAFWVVFSLVFVAVQVLAVIAGIIFVAKDTKERGVENAPLWIILVIVGGLLGLVAYLVFRPAGKSERVA